MDWNPHAPDVIGVEWAPRTGETLPEYLINAPIRAAAMRVPSTVTQAVQAIGTVFHGSVTGTRALLEVMEAGNEVASGHATTIFRPNAVDNVTGLWEDQDANTSDADLLDSIDGATFDSATYITHPANGFLGTTNSLDLQFATAGALTGQRILDVRLVVVGANETGAATPMSRLRAIVNGSTTEWYPTTGPAFSTVAPAPTTRVLRCGEINSATDQPWLLSEVQDLDSGTEIRLQFTSLISWDPLRIYQVWLEVDHCDENRMAFVNIGPGTSGDGDWATGTVTQPDGSADLDKVNGTDMTMVVRQPRYGDQKGMAPAVPIPNTFAVQYIEGLNDTQVVGLEQYPYIALNLDGTVSLLGDPVTDRTIGWSMQIIGGPPSSQSVDSQHYAATVPTLVDPAALNAPVQEVSGASAQQYDGVILPLNAPATPVNDLQINLRRRSDNVIMATAYVTPADYEAVPADPVAGWRLIQAPFDTPATLAAATQYYVQFLDVSGDLAQWQIQLLTNRAPTGPITNGGQLGTYRGSTDIATLGTGDDAYADFAVMVYAEPDAPTEFTAVAGSTPMPDPGPDCGIVAVGWVQLSWEPAVVGNFAYQEVQRADPFTDWQTIARITDDTVNLMVDQHPRFNVESCYRIRTVNVMGVASPWSDEACATCLPHGCGYTFTHNSVPEMAVGYADVGTPREFRFPEADEVKDVAIHGRDDYVSFVPSERRGSEFDRRLLLSHLVTQLRPAPDAADGLRDLSRMPVPFVCVRAEDGGRWFANVRVSELEWHGHGDEPPTQFVRVYVGQRTTVEEPIDVAP